MTKKVPMPKKAPQPLTVGLRPGLYREYATSPFSAPRLIPTPVDTWAGLQKTLAFVKEHGFPPDTAEVAFGPDTRTDVDRMRILRSGRGGWEPANGTRMTATEMEFLAKAARILLDHPMADLYQVYRWTDRVARWCWRGVAAVLNWRRPHGRARAFLPRLGHVQFPEGR